MSESVEAIDGFPDLGKVGCVELVAGHQVEPDDVGEADIRPVRHYKVAKVDSHFDLFRNATAYNATDIDFFQEILVHVQQLNSVRVGGQGSV